MYNREDAACRQISRGRYGSEWEGARINDSK